MNNMMLVQGKPTELSNGSMLALVTFLPNTAGTSTGTLSVTINGQSSAAATLALSGNGGLAAVTFSGQWSTDYWRDDAHPDWNQRQRHLPRLARDDRLNGYQ